MGNGAMSALMAAVALSGCSGLTQMQDTVSKFDEATHAVASDQMTFLRQVQVADCANQFYTAALGFATKQTDSLSLAGRCDPTILTNEQILVRQRLVDTLTIYADKIQALATSDTNKTLDRNAQSLAGKLNALAKSRGLSGAAPVAEGVETAIVAISEMALDQRRFTDVRQAARAMQPHVTKLVGALQGENVLFAEGMASKTEQLEIQLHLALARARDDQGPRSFLDVVAARDIFRSANVLGGSPGAASGTAGHDADADPLNAAKQVNAALDAVVNANDALANAGTGGAVAAVNDLVVRARHAKDILSALR